MTPSCLVGNHGISVPRFRNVSSFLIYGTRLAQVSRIGFCGYYLPAIQDRSSRDKCFEGFFVPFFARVPKYDCSGPISCDPPRQNLISEFWIGLPKLGSENLHHAGIVRFVVILNTVRIVDEPFPKFVRFCKRSRSSNPNAFACHPFTVRIRSNLNNRSNHRRAETRCINNKCRRFLAAYDSAATDTPPVFKDAVVNGSASELRSKCDKVAVSYPFIRRDHLRGRAFYIGPPPLGRGTTDAQNDDKRRRND